MNWGYKIAIFYTAFAVFILVLVAKSMNQKYDLVAEDYYEKELKFQGQIEKENLANSDNRKVVWEQNGNVLLFTFPGGNNINGEIKLFRPSDAAMDIVMPIKADDNGVQQVDIAKAGKGKYLLQIDWMENNKSYFQENVIIL